MSGHWRRLLADRGAWIGGALVVAMLLVALARPWIAPKDPLAPDIDRGLTAQGAPMPPSAESPLGTDQLGRDVWSRVVAGTGSSLEIAALATTIAVALGLLVGLIAGYAGGWVDAVLMRFVDLVLAFPFLLLAILLAALFRQTALADSNAPVVITLGAIGWTTMARVVRGKTAVLARGGVAIAARALGASPARIVMRHILPNLGGIAIVVATLGFAQNLLAESVLSYLGVGPPPPAPTWGRMLFEGRAYYRTAPHLAIAPGLAILIAVIAFNLLGERLRVHLDPKERV